MSDSVPTIDTVVTGLVALLEKALGDKLDTAAKAKFSVASNVIGTLLKYTEPFLNEKIDLVDLTKALSNVETALTAVDEAFGEFKLVFEGKAKAEAEVKTEEAKPAENVPLA